jgi:hypothetical protein
LDAAAAWRGGGGAEEATPNQPRHVRHVLYTELKI